MDKFKMELTWHNCQTCPPEEDFNPYLLVTDGSIIRDMVWDKKSGGFWMLRFAVSSEELSKYWWADITQTVCKTPEFKEI